MIDYKAMYLKLFNEISKSIELLQEAQRTTEEWYLFSDEEEPLTFPCQEEGGDLRSQE